MSESSNCDLVQKLKEKNDELLQAGEYGKSILDTNSHLETMLQEMSCDYEKKLEDLEQQNYSLEMKLEALKISEDQINTAWPDEKQTLLSKHSHEVETLQKQHRHAIDSINLKLVDMQAELEENGLVKQQLSKKVEKQQDTISELRAALEKRTVVSDPAHPELMELSLENERLQVERQYLEEENESLSHHVEQLDLKVKELEKVNEFLRETKENVEADMKSCSNALEECQNSNQELVKELEELRCQPQDPFSRGNSLFAEVEDRRVQAEKKLISCQVKLKCLEKKHAQQVNYTMTLKAQIAQLLHSGGRDADRERISRLEQALAISQKESKLLVDKVADLETKLSASFIGSIGEMKKREHSGDEFASFLEGLLQKKEAEAKKLVDELRKCQTDLIAETRRADENDEEIYKVQSERDRLKSQCIKLKMEVDRLKLKYGETVQGRRAVKLGKVEKLSDLPLQEKCTNANDENKEKSERNSKTDLKSDDQKVNSSERKSVDKRTSRQESLGNAPQQCQQQ